MEVLFRWPDWGDLVTDLEPIQKIQPGFLNLPKLFTYLKKGGFMSLVVGRNIK